MKRSRLTAMVVLLATALAGTLTSISAADAAQERGDGAVARAADRYGVSATGLRDRLRTDPNFRLTPSGAAISIDPAPTGKSEPMRLISQAFPLPDTFLMHSKPDSSKTIYLDFNGHNVSGTLWNTDFDGPLDPGIPVPNGSHPAWDLAGNGPSFTDAELLAVQDIYQRVAEDYAPFDVDVTTEEPSAGDIERANPGDNVYGTRALISPSNTALTNICGGNCGGVAFIGVYNWFLGADPNFPTIGHGQLQPAWVFPQALGNDPKNIAEATTHEVGHNFGLDHDGTNTLGYYSGHSSWGPIMGVGYSRPIVQFALNDYPNANLGGPGPGSSQPNPDDIATIVSHGAALRTDEPGTSTGNAGEVPAEAAYIRRRTDVDYFNLGTCAGRVRVTANNAPVSPNLDLQLRLLDVGNAVLDSDNPLSAYQSIDVASGLDAQVSASLPSGTYFAQVDGVGRGTATNGYTDYGSLGAYTLTTTGCDGIVKPPETAKPGKPRIGQAAPGRRGGAKTAKVTWWSPAAATNPPTTMYQVVVYRENNRGKFVKISTLPVVPATVRSATFTASSRARLKFAVKARNALGFGPLSAKSNAVRPR
jgi:hypothetical protein